MGIDDLYEELATLQAELELEEDGEAALAIQLCIDDIEHRISIIQLV